MSDYDNTRPSKQSPWNSLEVVKLIASLATPIAVAIAGYFVWSAQQRIVEQAQATQAMQQQRIVDEQKERERIREFRIEIYKSAGPLLNDIYVYHFHLGRWRELSPLKVIEKKRDLDALMYSHESLLSREFFSRYRNFMDQAFAPAQDWQSDVQIRTTTKCRIPTQDVDATRWKVHFTEHDNREQVCLAYRNLLEQLSSELLFQTLPTKSLPDKDKLSLCPRYDFSVCP